MVPTRAGTNGTIEGTNVTISTSKHSRAIGFIVGHEFTHRMQTLAPKEYAELKKAIREELGEETWREHTERMVSLYVSRNMKYDDALIEDEVVADYVGDMVENTNLFHDFVNKNKERGGVLAAIRRVLPATKARSLSNVVKQIDTLLAAASAAQGQATVETTANQDGDYKYSLKETDPATLKRLNSGETIKAYRAMQVIDGKLYPPMSARVDGKLREPIELGVWEKAEERPDLADDKGYFKLDKGNNSSLKARYNPYIHTSLTPLNDQFSSAQDRPNLVTVEVEVPASELTSGYKADKAKDTVGKVEWKAGVVQSQLSGTRTVILSRWDRPLRIIPDSEVAQRIVEMFGDSKVVMPSNVVTPSLRAELEKLGVPFKETTNQGKEIKKRGVTKHNTSEQLGQPTTVNGNPPVANLGTKLNKNYETAITNIENLIKEKGAKFSLREVMDNFQLTEENAWDFEYALMQSIAGGEYGARPDYRVVSGVEVRVKGHTPNWDNFLDWDTDEPRHKVILNVTVGDYENSDYRRNKTEYEEFVAEHPNTIAVDVTIEDGTYLGDAIKQIHEALAEKGADFSFEPNYDWADLYSEENNDLSQSEARYSISATEIAEIEAERKAIEETAKANGTWLKAPNGQPTNLSSKQWVDVRTKRFKAWFGDWELAELAEYLMSDDVVAILNGNEFTKDGTPLTEKVTKFYNENYNGKVTRKGLGEVILDKRSVKDSTIHGFGKAKTAAFAAVPNIITEGRVIDEQRNWKGRNYDSVTIAAPIRIGGSNYVGIVIVLKGQGTNSNRFYLHEVVLQENLQDESFKTDNKADSHRGDVAKVMQKIFISKANSSKIVDANGEPKVVYHQTNATEYVNVETGERWDDLDWMERAEWDERDDWDEYWQEREFYTFSRANARTTQEFDGFFFAPEYDEYHEYGDRTISAFLNIKNPASRTDYNIDSSKNNAGREERLRLQQEGYDGVIREENGVVWEYVAFEPNQIKSADPVTYDDNGDVIPLSERFNPENEDIRYSLGQPTDEDVTFDNFFERTSAIFTQITDTPTTKPDYISRSGSTYWYGEDERGKYVIRRSDHWSAIVRDEEDAGVFNAKPDDFNNIASCYWALDMRTYKPQSFAPINKETVRTINYNSGSKDLNIVFNDGKTTRRRGVEPRDMRKYFELRNSGDMSAANGYVVDMVNELYSAAPMPAEQTAKAYLDEFTKWSGESEQKSTLYTVSEVTMPDLEENNTMHSVDVTPAMRESVMQGQPKFSLQAYNGNFERKMDDCKKIVNAYAISPDVKLADSEADYIDALRYYGASDDKIISNSRGVYISGNILLNTSRITTPEILTSTILHENTHSITHAHTDKLIALLGKMPITSLRAFAVQELGYEEKYFFDNINSCSIEVVNEIISTFVGEVALTPVSTGGFALRLFLQGKLNIDDIIAAANIAFEDLYGNKYKILADEATPLLREILTAYNDEYKQKSRVGNITLWRKDRTLDQVGTRGNQGYNEGPFSQPQASQGDGTSARNTESEDKGRRVDNSLHALDAPYLEAVERGDMETAQRMVLEAAERTGYLSDTSYQGSLAFNGAAPMANAYFDTKEQRKDAWDNEEYDGTMSLGDYADNNIDTNDLEWQLSDRGNYRRAEDYTKESIDNINNAINGGNHKITIYRAVPNSVEEGTVRNGDWVTPSRKYAEYHIELQDWVGGRIIEQEVDIDNIWWNGDDINEWGYDDGSNYGYRNTPNNRKLLDPVTYDDNGNVIPLSERFNPAKEDVRYSISESWAPFSTTEAGKIAEQMRKAGVSPSEIYARTGWWWDAKGRMRNYPRDKQPRAAKIVELQKAEGTYDERTSFGNIEAENVGKQGLGSTTEEQVRQSFFQPHRVEYISYFQPRQ